MMRARRRVSAALQLVQKNRLDIAFSRVEVLMETQGAKIHCSECCQWDATVLSGRVVF